MNFSQRNKLRCEAANGFNHKLASWSLSDWITATLGELGEAANVVKKLNRVRDGIPGNRETPEQLHAMLAEEIADAAIYLDLLAQAAGFDLEEIRDAKFAKTSAKIGYVEATAAEGCCELCGLPLLPSESAFGSSWRHLFDEYGRLKYAPSFGPVIQNVKPTPAELEAATRKIVAERLEAAAKAEKPIDVCLKSRSGTDVFAVRNEGDDTFPFAVLMANGKQHSYRKDGMYQADGKLDSRDLIPAEDHDGK